jgi:phospholipid/cholesterol/gamma-HCH transport system ATP-binding protein
MAHPAAATPERPADTSPVPAVVFDHVSLAFDDHIVLQDLSFEIPRGSMTIVLGASGTGKTLILKLTLGLIRPDAGRILVDGRRIDDMPERGLLAVRAGIGMLFQESALFDSLTVAENVGYRLEEESRLPADVVRRRVEEVLGFIGLAELIDRMPATLSGGQRRRVAIARAMAHRPHLLLFDDPTTGLDPLLATSVDDEIVKLRDLEQVTALLVTHQIRDAVYIATHEAIRTEHGYRVQPAGDARSSRTRFMLLNDGAIRFTGSAAELLASTDPYLKEFLFMTLPPWGGDVPPLDPAPLASLALRPEA